MEANILNIFELLPVELVKSIHDFLNDEDRLFARSVCKDWFNQIKVDHFIIKILSPYQIPAMIEHFKKYSQFSLTVYKSDQASEKQLHNFINNLSNLTSIETRWLYKRSGMTTTLDLVPFTNLQKLILPFPAAIIQVIPHLTYLDVDSVITYPRQVLLPKIEVYIGPMNGVSMLNPDTLTSLTVKNIDSAYTKQISFNQFSRLKKLNIRAIDSHYAVYDGPFGGSEPRDPLNLDLPNLEELHVLMDFSLKSTRLTRLTLQDSVFKSLTYDHKRLTSLKALTILGTHYGPYLHDLPPHLEELVWENNSHHGFDLSRLPNTLTKVKALTTNAAQHYIFGLNNLQELYLETVRSFDVVPTIELSKLKKLTIRRATDVTLNFDLVPGLTEIDLQFSSKNGGSMNLAALTELRELIVPMTSNKDIIGLGSLINLERLEVPYVTDDVFQNLTKLTRLSCCQTDTCHQVSKLTLLRSLDYCFTADEDLVGLTNLQHLTHLICRTRTCNTLHVTLLARLQSIAVTSNVSERADWNVLPWSRNNARYEITSKLPHLILGPGKRTTDRLY